MTSIFSIFYHSASPLIRAFNLSNHGHKPAIHTKPPSFPDLSFISQNPPISHFTSTVSSMIRMPYDEWRNHQHSCHHVITRIIDPSLRMISFLREFSTYSSITDVVAADIPSAMCISSLIQMWKELKMESGVCPTPRISTAAMVEESSSSLDASDKSKLSEKIICCNAPTAAYLTSSEPSRTDYFTTETVTIDIPLAVQVSSPMQIWRVPESKAVISPNPHTTTATAQLAAPAEELSRCSDECDKFELPPKEIAGNSLTTSLLPSPKPSPLPYTGKKALCIYGWNELQDSILKPNEWHQRQLATLMECHPVFKFYFLGSIQSLIRMWLLRQKSTAIGCQQSTTIRRQQSCKKLEKEIFEEGSNNIFLRYLFIFLENAHFSKVGFPRDIEGTPHTFYSFQDFFTLSFRHEDQWKIQSFDASWDERSLWGSNCDRQKLSYSYMLQIWHDEIASNMIKMSTQEQHFVSAKCNWLLQPSNFWKEWG